MKIIKIDKSVPMPNLAPSGHPNKYPWGKMEVGDSFVPKGKEKSAYSLVWRASQKFAPKKFKASKDEDGVLRVWRTA